MSSHCHTHIHTLTHGLSHTLSHMHTYTLTHTHTIIHRHTVNEMCIFVQIVVFCCFFYIHESETFLVLDFLYIIPDGSKNQLHK